jgi:hypothetical protein
MALAGRRRRQRTPSLTSATLARRGVPAKARKKIEEMGQN